MDRQPVAGLPWHQALVFALLGEDHPELGVQAAPDLAEVEGWLRDQDAVRRVRALATRQDTREPWPVPVPTGLRLPAAQFAGALYALRSRLGLLGSVAAPAPPRTLTADEVRLLRDVPPHHG